MVASQYFSYRPATGNWIDYKTVSVNGYIYQCYRDSLTLDLFFGIVGWFVGL